jgi:hypothetical protein
MQGQAEGSMWPVLAACFSELFLVPCTRLSTQSSVHDRLTSLLLQRPLVNYGAYSQIL